MKLLRVVRWIPIVSIVLFILTIMFLGSITPGYDHTFMTISRLSIMKYGKIAEANLIQLGIGLLMLGIELAFRIKIKQRRLEILPFFLLATMCLFGAALAPTDGLGSPSQIFHMSKTGWIHVGAVIVFIALCPITVFTLVHAFASDPNWKTVTTITISMFSVAFLLSVLWFILFFLNTSWFMPYRGLFQKAIALWTLLWTLLVAVKVARESA